MKLQANWWICRVCGIYLPFQEALLVHQAQEHRQASYQYDTHVQNNIHSNWQQNARAQTIDKSQSVDQAMVQSKFQAALTKKTLQLQSNEWRKTDGRSRKESVSQAKAKDKDTETSFNKRTIGQSGGDEEPGALVIDTGRFSQTPPPTPTEVTNNEVGTKCQLCGSIFRYKSKSRLSCVYNAHLRKHHLDYVKKNWLLCNYCNKYYSNKDTLRHHDKRCPMKKKVFAKQSESIEKTSMVQDSVPSVQERNYDSLSVSIDSQNKPTIVLTPTDQDSSDSESSEDNLETNPGDFLHQSIKIEENQIELRDESLKPELNVPKSIELDQETSATSILSVATELTGQGDTTELSDCGTSSSSPAQNERVIANSIERDSPFEAKEITLRPEKTHLPELLDHEYTNLSNDDKNYEAENPVDLEQDNVPMWNNCQICKTSFPTQVALADHVRKHYQPNQSLICNDKTENSNLEVSQYFTIRTDETEVQNPDEFSSEEDVIQSVKIQSTISLNSSTCDICCKEVMKCQFNHHMRQNHVDYIQVS